MCYRLIGNSQFAKRELNKEVMKLKPQDILVLVKIFLIGNDSWKIEDIARSTGISKSEVHGAIKRLEAAKLLDSFSRRPIKAAMEEYLIHGLKYSFPVRAGSMERGIPAAHSAPPMSKHIESAELYVWPYESGDKRGLSVKPLYRTVPEAALKDNEVYEFMSLLDSLRMGHAREVKLASDEIVKRIRRKK